MKKAKVNIMVVEDNPVLLSFWERMLKDLNVSEENLYFTTDVMEAKMLLRQKGFDILITDVVLPEMNGYQLAKFASEQNPAIKILLTTGYNVHLSRFNLSGIKAHLIHKPYQNLDRLSTMLTHILMNEDPCEDADENSFSENEKYPDITEWSL